MSAEDGKTAEEALSEPPPSVDEKAAKSASTDKAPKKRGRPKGSKNKPKEGSSRPASEPRIPSEIKGIQKELQNLLTSPAFAFEAVGEEWPAKHVDRQGKILAAELANYAHKNPAFAARLKALLEGGENTKLIIAAAMYVAPLGIYFGVIPAPERARLLMGIPQKPGRIAPGPLSPVDIDRIPPEVRQEIEAEAISNGFTFEDGSADIKSYMDTVRENVEAMREGNISL